LVLAAERQRCSDRAAYSIYEATEQLMFFGTPHRGLLNTDDILCIIDAENNERAELVKSLNKNSPELQAQLQKFLDIAPRYRITSFYEVKKSKTLVKVRSQIAQV
jgi:hypothetical protein